MTTETTKIDIEFGSNISDLEKDFRKVHDMGRKTATQQVRGERASSEAQKSAARVANKSRKASQRDRKDETRHTTRQERTKQRTRREEANHDFKKIRTQREERSFLGWRERFQKKESKNRKAQEKSEKDSFRRQQRSFSLFKKRNRMGGGGAGGRFAAGLGRGSGVSGMFSGTGGLAGAAGGALGGLAVGAVSGIVSIFTDQLKKGIAEYEKENLAASGIVNMTGRRRLDSGDAVRRSEMMGFSKTETYRQAALIARQTGSVAPTTYAQELSRTGAGVGVEEIGGVMGTLTRGGQGFNSRGGGAGKRALTQLFTHAVASGLDRSRTGEHLDAVSSLVQDVGGRTAGDVNAGGISGMLAWLGRSGQSGFQGARGAKFLGGIDAGIRGGGKGDASKAMVLQAMGFGFGDQKNVSYIDAVRKMERGIFGEGGADNLQNVMDVFKSQSGGGDRQLALMQESGVFGNATIDQLDDFRERYEEMAGSGDFTGLEEEISKLKSASGSIQEKILEATKSGDLKVARQLAKLNNRSAAQGEKLYDSVIEMQNLTNRLVDIAMPSVIAGINQLVGHVSQLAEFLLPSGSTRRTNDGAIAAMDSRLTDALTDTSLSDQEKSNVYSEILAEARAHENTIIAQRNSGLIDQSTADYQTRSLGSTRRMATTALSQTTAGRQIANAERERVALEQRTAEVNQARAIQNQAPMTTEQVEAQASAFGAAVANALNGTPTPVEVTVPGTQPADQPAPNDNPQPR